MRGASLDLCCCGEGSVIFLVPFSPSVAMTRNLLDVRISRGKRNGKPKGELSAHCRAGDAACVEEHRSIKVHLNASTLVETLTHDREKYEERLQKVLDQKGVRYLHVAFDELFVGEDEGEVRMRMR